MMLSLPYIAGFFDGEGHISLNGYSRGNSDGRGRFACGVSQAGPEGLCILTKIKVQLSSVGIYACLLHKAPLKEGSKEIYNLSVTGWDNGIRFLELIFPYLEVKRQRAQDVIRYSKVFPSMRKLATKISWDLGRRKGACTDPIVLAQRKAARKVYLDNYNHTKRAKVVV